MSSSLCSQEESFADLILERNPAAWNFAIKFGVFRCCPAIVGALCVCMTSAKSNEFFNPEIWSL
jgi:hypothetical protein